MSKATRPSVLAIGHVTWTVEYLKADAWAKYNADSPDDDYGDNNRGECQWAKCNIAILDESTEDMIRDALYHEIMHAVWGVCGLSYINEKNQLPKDPYAREEFLITLAAPAMLQFMGDNPNVVAYLMGK